MARHVITMHFDSVLVQLSLRRPDLEMLLPADCIFTQVVLMPEVFCTSSNVLQPDEYKLPRKQHRSCHHASSLNASLHMLSKSQGQKQEFP